MGGAADSWALASESRLLAKPPNSGVLSAIGDATPTIQQKRLSEGLSLL
jgi:hypothetical protein